MRIIYLIYCLTVFVSYILYSYTSTLYKSFQILEWKNWTKQKEKCKVGKKLQNLTIYWEQLLFYAFQSCSVIGINTSKNELLQKYIIAILLLQFL